MTPKSYNFNSKLGAKGIWTILGCFVFIILLISGCHAIMNYHYSLSGHFSGHTWTMQTRYKGRDVYQNPPVLQVDNNESAKMSYDGVKFTLPISYSENNHLILNPQTFKGTSTDLRLVKHTKHTEIMRPVKMTDKGKAHRIPKSVQKDTTYIFTQK